MITNADQVFVARGRLPGALPVKEAVAPTAMPAKRICHVKGMPCIHLLVAHVHGICVQKKNRAVEAKQPQVNKLHKQRGREGGGEDLLVLFKLHPPPQLEISLTATRAALHRRRVHANKPFQRQHCGRACSIAFHPQSNRLMDAYPWYHTARGFVCGMHTVPGSRHALSFHT